MTMKILLAFPLIAAAVLLTGCEESSSPFAYKKQAVVTGLIESGRSIDTVKLVYTGDLDKLYNPADYAITNAVVRVIGVDVAFDDTLVHDPSIPGRYHSIHPANIIRATKSYRLDVRIPGGPALTAVTTVPDTFSLGFATLTNNTTIRYNAGAPVNFFSWTPSRFHGTYLPTITSLDSGAARIMKTFIRDTTDGVPPEKIGYRVGLPKEQTYTELPWIVLNYYGTTRFDVYAVDENYNAFLNQFVGGQGGELAEIRYNVVGGLGVFGARTQAKGGITVYITP